MKFEVAGPLILILIFRSGLALGSGGTSPNGVTYFPPQSPEEAACLRRLLPLHPPDFKIEPDGNEQLTVRMICGAQTPPGSDQVSCIASRIKTDPYFFSNAYSARTLCDPGKSALRACVDQAKANLMTSELAYRNCTHPELIAPLGQKTPKSIDIPDNVVPVTPGQPLGGVEALGPHPDVPMPINGLEYTPMGAAEIQAVLPANHQVGGCTVAISEFKCTDPKLKGFDIRITDLKGETMVVRVDSCRSMVEAPYRSPAIGFSTQNIGIERWMVPHPGDDEVYRHFFFRLSPGGLQVADLLAEDWVMEDGIYRTVNSLDCKRSSAPVTTKPASVAEAQENQSASASSAFE